MKSPNRKDLKAGPDTLVTFNTQGWIGTRGDADNQIGIRLGTFLCPRCDKTHVVIQCSNDFDDPEQTLEVTFKLTPEAAEGVAREFTDPNPIDPQFVIDMRNKQ